MNPSRTPVRLSPIGTFGRAADCDAACPAGARRAMLRSHPVCTDIQQPGRLHTVANETPANANAPENPGYDLHGDTDPELYTHTLASIVVKNGDVPQPTLKAAMVKWREQFFSGGSRNLAEVLVEMGAIKRVQIPLLLKATRYALCRREDKVFGKRAYRRQMITRTQLDESLAFQKQLFKALHEVKRLETILIDDGFLKPEDAKKIWLEFSDYKGTRRPANKPASVLRAAKSAGIPVDDREVEEEAEPAPATADKPDAVPPSESAGGSALDLESLKAEVKPSGEVSAADAAAEEEEEDPGAMMASHMPPPMEVTDIRPSRREEQEAWKKKKREEAARLAKEEVAQGITSFDLPDEEDDFSNDNMDSALDGAIDELDLSDDLKREDGGEGKGDGDQKGDAASE